jgi:uncharacterized CHY-type Zn-finger protein
MTASKQVSLAYKVAIALFVLGVVSYAIAASQPPPDRPVRMMLTASAGSVMFDHKTHTDITGYGISCGECHHTLAEDEYEYAGSCSECHEVDSGDEDVPKRSDALHQQCYGCHSDFGAGPVKDECNSCHRRY